MEEDYAVKLDEMDRKMNRMSAQVDDMYQHGVSKKSNAQMIASQSEDSYASMDHKKNYVVEEDDEEEGNEGKTDFTKDENADRGNWSGRLDFLLACLGYAVGLGNVWRFPYLCYKNGGAVFFIPYIIMLLFVGIPIFMLELSLGQFTSQGPLTCWEFAPIFKGIGVGMVIVSGLVGIYYNMIIAWAIFYTVASFTTTLPWEKCEAPWAGPWCNLPVTQGASCMGLDMNESRGVCWNTSVYLSEINYYQPISIMNSSEAIKAPYFYRPSLPSQDYLNRRVIMKDLSSIDNMGPMSWELVLCYLAAFIIVGAALINGVKSSGKVVYFTALFPYVVLVVLLVRGLTLEGYYKGIQFYILEPDLNRLSDSAVWKDAAVQIFFSLSDSWGGLIALASYNRFHNDCLRDTLIVSLGNCITSFFAGFVIFSFMGFLATITGQEVKNVVDSGVGLAFIVYPDAVTRMPVSPLWAILFFVMLITLGLDSEFALVETVTTAFIDQFPKTRRLKWLVIIVTCIILFLLGLPLCTWGGCYLLQLLDSYSGGWNVLVIALLECISIAYVYGFCRFKEDIRTMIGNSPCCCLPWNCCYWFWAVMWYFFTPIGVLFILIYSWVDYSEATYGNYVFPVWAAALGWLMTLAVISGIFVTFIAMAIFYKIKGRPMRDLVRPSIYWGPALKKHRKLMLRYLDPSEVVLDPWGDESDNNFPPGEVEMGKQDPVDGYDNTGYEQKF